MVNDNTTVVSNENATIFAFALGKNNEKAGQYLM